MNRFWTADFHLGHYNKNGGIIAYCNRPFRNLAHMNAALIKEANMRVKPEDTGIHVGDFCVRSSNEKFAAWREQLHGKWVFTRGNHDKNNGVRTACTSMFVRMAHFQVFVSHIPFFYEDFFPVELREYVVKYCDFALCGHVHEKWADRVEGIPVLNVGVDVRKYRPISDDELCVEYLKIKREGNHGKHQTPRRDMHPPHIL